MNRHLVIYLLMLLVLFNKKLNAQDSSLYDKVNAYPQKFFTSLDSRAKDINQKLDKQTIKYLNKLEREEEKLMKQLAKKDSLLSGKLFTAIQDRYQKLRSISGKVEKYQNLYSGHLDSLTTSLNFLKSSKLIDLTKSKKIDNALSQYMQLQEKLNATNKIKNYLEERETYLKDQLKKFNGFKEFKKFKEQVYYYQAQLKECKQEFEDPSKIEKRLISILRSMPAFREYFSKFSLLNSAFASNTASTIISSSSLGLQTRSSINPSVNSRLGSSINVDQILHQKLQLAQGMSNSLKNKLESLASGYYGNANEKEVAKKDFKPNDQKTKRFLNRLEISINLQSQKASSYFPVTSDIGFSVGYKLNNKSIIGLGASGKVGWGTYWNKIRVSYQGVGLRSFVDYKFKEALFISGGYEKNYLSVFHSFTQLKDYNSWKNSGLIGFNKKFQVSKKVKGNMKLLWDFLSYRQIPKTQPLLFRIGYNLK